MSHNSSGGGRRYIRAHESLLTAGEIEERDRANFWRAFEKLPPKVRELLANAAYDWRPQPFLTRWRRGWTVEQIANAIEGCDSTKARQR